MVGRRDLQEDALDHLGSEAQCVLAVLVMAALWPERYTAGWVRVSEFARAGVLLGVRVDRESLKAAIRRGLRRLRRTPGIPGTESRRTLECDETTARVRRERDRRLVNPVEASLERWFLRNGPGLVAPDVWRAFMALGPGRPSLDPAGARELLRQSLRRAQACLGFAALSIPPETREGQMLNRILAIVGAGIRETE